MKSVSQKGFAALEGILILIIVAVIGGIGWYALHTKHQTDKILSQADKISQNTPAKTSSDSSSGYFNIKEWRVRAPYTGKLHLIYKINNDSNSSVAGFSSQELAAASSQCIDSGAGMIIKADGSMHIYAPDGAVAPAGSEAKVSGTDNGSVKDFFDKGPGVYSKVGTNYYWYAPDQFNCGQSSSVTQLQQETADAVKAISSSLKSY